MKLFEVKEGDRRFGSAFSLDKKRVTFGIYGKGDWETPGFWSWVWKKLTQRRTEDGSRPQD